MDYAVWEEDINDFTYFKTQDEAEKHAEFKNDNLNIKTIVFKILKINNIR